jgi:site-specific DNA-cytosine methylase
MEERRIGNIYGFDGGNFAGNVYDKDSCSPTIRTYQGGNQQPCVVAMRGRNPENPSERTSGSPTEQRLEPNMSGTSKCLTSVQKDNLVLEPKYRIRKLTPRECGRLMGVSDEDISKMAAVNSNTQLYKQFGNSIVVDVMCAMFKNLNIEQGSKISNSKVK